MAYRYGQARAAARAANAEMDALSEANKAKLMADAQGARWHRNPDGSWMRWSYLGGNWEKAEPPTILLQAVELKPGETYWTVSPNGGWMPYDPSKPSEAPAVGSTDQSEQLPSTPMEPPRLDPDNVERPQWTDGWKPGWKEEFK